MQIKNFLLLSALIFFAACDARSPAAPETTAATGVLATLDNPAATASEPVAPAALEDYFPIKENAVFEYVSEENEYLNYHVFNSFIEGNKIQQSFISPNSRTDSVLEVSPGEVKLYVNVLGNYFIENLIAAEPTDDSIVLKGPVKVGTKWSSPTIGDSEITSLAAPVSTPYGDFEALEVTTEAARQGEDTVNYYVTKDYYVKGIGLVKTVIANAEGLETTVSLNKYSETSDEKMTFQIFVPNENGDALETLDVTLVLKTNQDNLALFEGAFKNAGLMNDSAKINFIRADAQTQFAEVDFTRKFIDEMNLGAGIEALTLQGLTDTICQYTGAVNLAITIDGGRYESGHIVIEKGEYYKPSWMK